METGITSIIDLLDIKPCELEEGCYNICFDDCGKTSLSASPIVVTIEDVLESNDFCPAVISCVESASPLTLMGLVVNGGTTFNGSVTLSGPVTLPVGTDLFTLNGNLVEVGSVVVQTANQIGVTPSGNLASTNIQNALVEHQNDIDSINAALAAGPFTVADTNTIDMVKSGNNIAGYVKISGAVGNSLIQYPDGLYAYVAGTGPGQTPLTIVDTSTIDFSVSGANNHTLTGVVKVSADVGNDLEIRADGLYVDAGDVQGPSSSINNHVVLFDGTTGKIIKDSGLLLSGNNTGDQTSIVGITGTKAQFDTSVTDGNFLYVGDITQYTDEQAQDAIGNILVDSTEIDFTYNDATPSITASIVAGSIDESKLDASVNASLDLADTSVQPAGLTPYFNKSVDDTDDITEGTTNKYNATHTGEMTGATALTAAPTLVSNKTLKSTLAGTEEVLINDAGTLKKTTAQDIADLGGGGGGTPGGSTTEVQFNDGGAFGGATNFVWDKANNRVGIMTNTPTHTQTFGSASTGISLYNTSDQTTNYERCVLGISGGTYGLRSEAGGTGINRPFTISGNGRSYTFRPSANDIFEFNGGSSGTLLDIYRLAFASSASSGTLRMMRNDLVSSQTGSAGWTMYQANVTGTDAGTGTKLFAHYTLAGVDKYKIRSDGSEVISAGGRTELYNTTDETTNYERCVGRWNSNRYELYTNAGGTGTVRQMRIGVSSASGNDSAGRYLEIGGATMFNFQEVTSVNGRISIGNTLTHSGTANTAIMCSQNLVANQTGTAGWTLYHGNITGTDGGSGTKRFIDLYNQGVSRYYVDDNGNGVYAGNITGANLSGTNTGDETNTTIKTKLGVASSGVDGYLSGTDWNTFNSKQNALGFTPENSANKGAANGYASLDATAKVPLSQIPSSVIGALNYQGSWNASTNTPTLSDGAGSKGLYYVVTVAGSQNLGSGSITYDAGDWVVHNGTIWERLNDGDVTTVNGQSGVVTLTKTDVGLGSVDNTSDATKNSATVTLTNKTISLGSNTISGTIAQFNAAITDGDMATLAGTETLTNKTLTAPRIANAGFIADANGNELLVFTTTTSAVNELTFNNAATGNNPGFLASGGDANIGINLTTKGTGVVGIRGNSTQAATLALYEDTDDGSNFSAFRASPRTTDIVYLMPTTDPTAGQTLTAGLPSSGVSQLSWSTASGGIGDVGASVYKSVGQTGTGGVRQTLTWNNENYDTSSFHDNATNNDRLVAPSTGKYLVVLNVNFAPVSGGNYVIAIHKNGGATEIVKQALHNANSSYSPCLSLSLIIQLNSGDYVDGRSFCSGSHTVYSDQSLFTIQRIA